ncbi:MAG: DUF433 domain-containing protein [Pseudomonadota bacterium]
MMRENENLIDRITIEPGKMGGQPCIRGLRMRVVDVLDLLASGMSRAEILEDYPDIEDADLSAALTYAAHTLGKKTIVAA